MARVSLRAWLSALPARHRGGGPVEFREDMLLLLGVQALLGGTIAWAVWLLGVVPMLQDFVAALGIRPTHGSVLAAFLIMGDWARRLVIVALLTLDCVLYWFARTRRRGAWLLVAGITLSGAFVLFILYLLACLALWSLLHGVPATR